MVGPCRQWDEEQGLIYLVVSRTSFVALCTEPIEGQILCSKSTDTVTAVGRPGFALCAVNDLFRSLLYF